MRQVGTEVSMYNDGAKEFKCYLNPMLDRRKARFRDECYVFYAACFVSERRSW